MIRAENPLFTRTITTFSVADFAKVFWKFVTLTAFRITAIILKYESRH